jgi:hypothetical protein
MSIHDPEAHESHRIVHEFTSLRRMPQLSSITINDPERLVKDYPQLSCYSHEEVLRTQVIAAEATIRLGSGKLPDKAELGIRLELNSNGNLDKYDSFSCRAQFYEHGQLLKFRIPEKDEHGNHTGKTFEDTEVSDRIEYDSVKKRLGNVHFGSDFWAQKLALSMSCLKKTNSYRAKADGCDDAQQAIKYETAAKEAENNLMKSFQTLTALQDITATLRSNGKTERLLLVCWRFEQCIDENNVGETTWRNVIVNQASSQPAVPGALPYLLQPVKGESLSQVKWEDGAMNVGGSADTGATTLQQPFDHTQAYALPDFSSIAMHGLPTTVTGGEIPSQLYTDNDLDFTGGHIQLNLAQQLPVSMALDTYQHDAGMGNDALLYEQAPSWQELSYRDPYFGTTTQNAYTFRTYKQHESPYSEPGAQQHDPIEQIAQHNAFAEPIQHGFPLPESMPQNLSPEEKLRQHVCREARSQNISPQRDMSQSGYPADARAHELNPEYVLQSVEFGTQSIPV